MDEFQERYLNHQERKQKSLENFEGSNKIDYLPIEKIALINILHNRRSQRIFNNLEVSDEDFNNICEAIRVAPSSCNRQAIYIKDVNPNEIEPLLVGGKGWINKSNKVILLFADKLAYKSPNEKAFMPYLDAGFVSQNIYIMCEILGLGCCFVNPNIREENKQTFVDKYGDDYFCGAFAIGNYDRKAKRPPLRSVSEVLRK